jgi:ElaB/YqjD/DUF883 family membrane-anchored ribosome-binding protein
MARTASNTAKSVTKALNGSSEIQDIEEQIEALRSDISNLSKSLSAAGSSQIEQAKLKASEMLENVSETSEQKIELLKQELSTLQDNLNKQVSDKPYQSLGIALGLGVLATLLLRR